MRVWLIIRIARLLGVGIKIRETNLGCSEPLRSVGE
jgi:hypothetical protein